MTKKHWVWLLIGFRTQAINEWDKMGLIRCSSMLTDRIPTEGGESRQRNNRDDCKRINSERAIKETERVHTVKMILVSYDLSLAFWAWVFACARRSFCRSAMTRRWLKYSICGQKKNFHKKCMRCNIIAYPAFSTALFVLGSLLRACWALFSRLHNANAVQTRIVGIAIFPTFLSILSRNCIWRLWFWCAKPPHDKR